MLCEHGNVAPCVECDVDPLKAENEALRERVAELEEAASWCEAENGDMQSLMALTRIVKRGNSRPWLLRKQAEAVGSLRFPTMMRKMWSGGEVQEWLDDQAKLFSDEADEAERVGDNG